MNSLDLSGQSVITGKDLQRAVLSGVKEVIIAQGAVLTSTARDIIVSAGLEVIKGGAAPCASSRKDASMGKMMRTGSPEALFRSPEAQRIKEEIVSVGHKLWAREFVDGNGGNISYRMTDDYVLCTPTLMSKGDLEVDDICLVDMEGKQLAGKQKRTSEVLTHLAIYKAQPKAKSCVHAHPPYATAYAITGSVPPNCIIPEHEVFVGQVAITPYETPGTKTLADHVVALAQDHNTILLGNHGVITWGDTVTHAEWYMEVVDTYCKTLVIASQLGTPITYIPREKTQDLMDLKKSLDLPDPRISGKECTLCDVPDTPGGITICPKPCKNNVGGVCKSHGTSCSGGSSCCSKGPADPQVEALINKITDQVMDALRNKN